MLNRLVDEALKANLSLALAEANLRQARALRGIAVAGLFPSATASGAYQRQSGPLYGTNGNPRNFYLATVDAAWESTFSAASGGTLNRQPPTSSLPSKTSGTFR